MSKKLEGKIALVTGGTEGIGLATAKRFVAEGATVIITGRRKEVLDAAVKEIGSGVSGFQGDAGNLADLDKLYAHIKQQHGRLDILFANAGIGEFASIDQVTEEQYNKIFNVNVKGVLFGVQKALPLIPDGGAIVLNASIVSVKGIAGFGVYSATKAAVRSFARTWTSELKNRKIRVNVVSPGPIETPAISRLVGDEESGKQFRAGMTSQVPLGRMGEADEIAKAVVFLASDDASFVAGVELYVDGGMVQV
ncbi:NAD(P)-dependent dehydrogenase (short-subunit alcohol dehydrogenase family) [Silvibacterium bohemicum]|uniref:NAD(P)-dependent dehydrogenase (Short-subunit alcohol dehydrogenase family) n=1 Tax=Silvibacterium bohemicum TaxID=1577686 RepID=A0A841JMD3_9BACT|nr:glucose 1-dehydrogenase [Silvibacterium bohemicum]MBB6142393.1 NAD(P)-dependent dehydrogenase (short-subunit alcohol dehydrogenase family) [Silvibacterium bohemicum]